MVRAGTIKSSCQKKEKNMIHTYTNSMGRSTEAYAIAARADEERTRNMIEALKASDDYLTFSQKRELGELIMERLSDK
jgi:hypothetical protein